VQIVTTNDITAGRTRLAELDAELKQLRERYDVLMNAFRFEAAKAIHARIEACESERKELAEHLPPLPSEPPPAPFTVARRRRR
jgi:hypothetical protein